MRLSIGARTRNPSEGATILTPGATTFTEADRSFISRVGGEELSDEEFRALLHINRNQSIDNANLRDRGLLELHAAGSQSFYTLAQHLSGCSDRGELLLDRGEQLAVDLKQAVISLGVRPRKNKLRKVIAMLCEDDWRTPAWLSEHLSIDRKNLTDRHLGPMAEDGDLERLNPDTPTDARQAYRAKAAGLFRTPS